VEEGDSGAGRRLFSLRGVDSIGRGGEGSVPGGQEEKRMALPRGKGI